MTPHTLKLNAALAAALSLLSLQPTPALAGPRSADPAAAHAAKVKKLKEGAPSAVNDAYYTIAARQRAGNTMRVTVPNGGALANDGSTNVSSVVLQPGARLVGDIVIVTEISDLTVVNQRGRGP